MFTPFWGANAHAHTHTGRDISQVSPSCWMAGTQLLLMSHTFSLLGEQGYNVQKDDPNLSSPTHQDSNLGLIAYELSVPNTAPQGCVD